MKQIMKVLNHPAEAYREGSKAISWGLVILTVLINSVFDPVLGYFCSEYKPGIDLLRILKVTGLGVLTYILISFVFWIVCKLFGSDRNFKEHLNSWGMSYVPTAICAVVVSITEVFFYVFWNNTIWGMLLNIVFVGILIWKTILYFIYLYDFAGLRGWRALGACIVMCIIILIIAALDGAVGLKTPVL